MAHEHDSKSLTIAIDLDGTAAEYNGWVHHASIGKPVPAMIEFIQRCLAAGHTVYIFTARLNAEPELIPEIEDAIRKWCVTHIGQELPMTGKKLLQFSFIFDDRARSIVANLGVQDTVHIINRFAARHMDEEWLQTALSTLLDLQAELHPAVVV